MTRPRISVVTPSYNQAEFIQDTLASVARQDYGDVEHLVMDGGSTDGTVELLREHAEATNDDSSYTFRWVSEPDDGQSDAINQGFERTTGESVAWLNSDDVYFDPGVLGRAADQFQRTGADVIYGDLAYIDRKSTIVEVDVRPDFDAGKLPYRILIGQPATFFRREVVDAERLDTSLDYSMDYEYWLRLAERFEFAHVTDVWAGFRSYEAQKSQDQAAMAAELKNILSEYPTDRDGPSVVVDNAAVELQRLARAVRATYSMHRNPPELAFDGDLAPLGTMLANLGPSTGDVMKAWRRWRSGGTSG